MSEGRCHQCLTGVLKPNCSPELRTFPASTPIFAVLPEDGSNPRNLLFTSKKTESACSSQYSDRTLIGFGPYITRGYQQSVGKIVKKRLLFVQWNNSQGLPGVPRVPRGLLALRPSLFSSGSSSAAQASTALNRPVGPAGPAEVDWEGSDLATSDMAVLW